MRPIGCHYCFYQSEIFKEFVPKTRFDVVLLPLLQDEIKMAGGRYTEKKYSPCKSFPGLIFSDY